MQTESPWELSVLWGTATRLGIKQPFHPIEPSLLSLSNISPFTLNLSHR
jgi:hypothetical protein